MAIEIKSPTFPESVADGVVAAWHKQPGEAVSRDDLLVDIETDKVVLEVVAPADGVIESIIKNEGDTVLSEEVIAIFAAGATAAPAQGAKSAVAPEAPAVAVPEDTVVTDTDIIMSPSARKLVDENKLDPRAIPGSGKSGRLTKEDVVNYLNVEQPITSSASTTAAQTTPIPAPSAGGSAGPLRPSSAPEAAAAPCRASHDAGQAPAPPAPRARPRRPETRRSGPCSPPAR